MKTIVARVRGVHRQQRTDRGVASIELVIIAPVLLILLLSVVQAGLWFYARNVALSAAQEATHVTRGVHGDAAAGRAAATSLLQRTGGDILDDVEISITETTTSVSTTVTGTSISLVPGLTITVQQTATAPTERTG